MTDSRPATLPPGPPGTPFLGNLLAFRRDPLAFMSQSAARYGDVVHYRFGSRDLFLLTHPEHIKDVLVTHQHGFAKGMGIQWAKLFLGEGLLTSEGEFHTKQRRLAQPAFHRQRIGAYGSVMAAYTERARLRWTDGQQLDFGHEMMTLTLAIVGKALFDVETEAEASAIGESLTVIVEMFPRFALPFASTIQKLPLPSNYRFRRACARLDATVRRIIAERRQDDSDRGDLLSMLMLARNVEGDGAGMSDAQLRDEVMTLLLAGHETTANALTWTFYLLSQNPEAEARLHAEIDTVLQGRLPGFDDIPQLPFAERVLAESMRLYPPAFGMGRRILEDYAVGGWVLPAGSFVGLYPWVTHRDARWFPDPLRFDPDRFLPEARAARPKFAYFPFGGGARSCIGEPFAWMEGILLTATLAQAWRFRLVPGHVVEPQALITLRPRHGMRMIAHRR